MDTYPSSRSDLEAVLAEAELESFAYDVAHKVAQHSVLARATEDRGARSRVGGPAIVPAGTAWPRDAAGKLLSFLAAVDVREVPNEVGVIRRVAGDWLLLFARLDEPGVSDRGPVPDQSLLQVLVSDGDPTVASVPDHEDPPHELPLIRVRWDPYLTLPGPEGAGIKELGLSEYEALLEDLDSAVPATSPQIFIGGFVPNAQGERAGLDDGELLLSVGTDIDEYIVLTDQATVQIFAPPNTESIDPLNLTMHVDY